jgi:23S rRNA-/tRNA-specific pseudouridylate synthase
VRPPVIRYLAPAGASTGLAELCARLGGTAELALEQGRLFVDRVRATGDRNVDAGSVIEVYAPRDAADDVTVLHEREGLVFVAKPPGIPTEPDRAGSADSVIARAAAALGVPATELHALSRLDAGVSGVVTLARTPTARAVVDGLRKSGRFGRRYLALALAAPEPRDGTWSGAIARGARGRRQVSPADAEDARAATTHYRTVAESGPVLSDGRDAVARRVALLALTPVTGRTHQLRAHAASAGAPLLGDPSYGGPRRARLADGRVLPLPRVLLHAAWAELELHGERLRVAAPPPPDFVSLWEAVGGNAAELERALELEPG